MSAKFISRDSVYKGDYNCIMRNPHNEFINEPHYHDFYEIQIYFSDAGMVQINNVSYEMHYGNIVLLNIFEPHKIALNSSKNYDRFCISVDPSFLLSVCSEKSNLLNIFNSKNKNYPILQLEHNEFHVFEDILLRYEANNLKQGNDILERALIYELLANLYDRFFDGEEVNLYESQQIELITRIIHLINHHLDEDLSLDRLANELNFSKYYICRIFKKYTNDTINKYITSKRIQKVISLLNSDLSINDISLSAGFNNYSYFYKTFLKITKMSPFKYRSLYSKNSQ